jgi:2-polyprenyl-3-methyl-5-hydroxy-6-metoxy-1,4-benzoquinol methylase
MRVGPEINELGVNLGESRPTGRVGIFVVSFNAVQHLTRTISRIPPEVYEGVEEIFIFDDCSQDDTFYAGVGFKFVHGLDKLRIYKNTRNLRYGGNQKRGYLYALDRGFEVVVLLHGDGQYAPEMLWSLIEPLLSGEADMVMGTRMQGGALRGGMPLYKFVGNRVLTRIQNRLAGTRLSEFHSGYRAFRCDALRKVPFLRNSDEWHFDTQMILQFQGAGLRIREVPIPTFYGDEICHVNGLAYAWNCIRTTIGYRLHRKGLVYNRKYDTAKSEVEREQGYPGDADSLILDWFGARPASRVLEVGCGHGRLAAGVAAAGHRVVGVERDAQAAADAARRGVEVACADPEGCEFSELGREFDVVLAADILEHVRNPGEVLARAVQALRADGLLLLVVPNIANLLIRVLLLLGYFPYGGRGILDRAHLQFFTLRSALELVHESGLKLQTVRATTLPVPLVFPSLAAGLPGRLLFRILTLLTRRFKKLLGYQFVIEAQKVGYREEREAVSGTCPPKATPDSPDQARSFRVA